MQQPLFTYSPDGVRVYAFSPSVYATKLVFSVFCAMLCGLALALLKLAELCAGVVTFFMTAPEGVLLRLVGIGVALTVSLIGFSLYRAASARKVGA